ncbi:MAG: adenine phosphoribosyltransferase [Spirochaetales bacterium]|nr:adenine phosphoribosyltransferase [Spirochaetales bacterium]
MSKEFNLDDSIRKIEDFPHKGILYFDITSILTNPEAFSWCIDQMVEYYKDKKIDAVAAVESRGFIFSAPFAKAMNIPLILVRKAGKLPGVTLKKSYQLEYGKAEVEIHQSDVPQGKNVLLVDDLLATGGTMGAAVELLTMGGAKVNHIFGIIGLPFLKYADKLPGIEIKTLIEYHSEKVDEQ